MKEQRQIQETSSSKWCWSIDFNIYDRRPELDAAERTELEHWMRWHGKGYGKVPRQTAQILQRLIRPIEDVFELLDFNPKPEACRLCIQLLLLEMRRRQTTFWAWTATDWLENIGKNHKDFRQRYQTEHGRQHLLAAAYVLLSFTDFWSLRFEKYGLASKVFGQTTVNATVQSVLDALKQLGYETDSERYYYRAIVCESLLANRSPRLEDLTEEALVTIRQQVSQKHQKNFVALSSALERLGFLTQPIERLTVAGRKLGAYGALEGVPAEWADLSQRWFNTSTLSFESRNGYFYKILIAGRWLAQLHPEVTHPAQWTRQLAAEYVAAVDRMKVGQFSQSPNPNLLGKPLSARSKSQCLASLRTFFLDCQEWEWIPKNFNAQTALCTPRSINALLQPKARQIADEVWVKLLSAGLNLTNDDLNSFSATERRHWYPVEMVRALAAVWFFCGLRYDEIRRLPVGCVRYLKGEGLVRSASGIQKATPNDEVCLLDVPPGKNGSAFTKAVDSVVGRAIALWEEVRPEQSPLIDRKTGERVDYLFAYRGRLIGTPYLNKTLIPLLCHKAGVPESDVRGQITSHRARHTIFTQLSESMTLPELQSWSGHKHIDSLSPYLKPTLTKQAQAYQKTDYFQKNLRTFEVLIDQQAITSGAAAAGEPWKYHDLGDGYCTYDFYEQCPHRMACTKCSFYKPKNLVEVKLLESKTNLQRMLQEISLTEEERLAIEDGIEAFEQLCERLADVPTPAGLTPRQISSTSSEDVA